MAEFKLAKLYDWHLADAADPPHAVVFTVDAEGAQVAAVARFYPVAGFDYARAAEDLARKLNWDAS